MIEWSAQTRPAQVGLVASDWVRPGILFPAAAGR